METTINALIPGATMIERQLAFEGIWSKARVELVIEAERRCMCQDAAQDVIQATATEAWIEFDASDGAPLIATQSGVLPWLVGLLHIECKRFLSERNTICRYERPINEEIDRAPSLEDERESRRQFMLETLDKLEMTNQQEMIVRQWINGKTQRQIADFFGISQAAVSQNLKPILHRLELAGADVRDSWYSGHWFQEASRATVYHKPTQLFRKTRRARIAETEAR